MFLNRFVLAGLLVFGSSVMGMEKHGNKKSKVKNAKTAKEWKLLYYVSMGYNPKAMGHLKIDLGNIRDGMGYDLVDIAIMQNDSSMIKLLKESGVEINGEHFIRAICNYRFEAAKTLINLDMDVNYFSTHWGSSVLIFAVQHTFVLCNKKDKKKALKLIPLLIVKGAKLDVQDKNGNTAYDLAYAHMKEKNEWDYDLLELLKPSQNIVENCPICMESSKKSLITTECNHTFHKSCLRMWAKKNNSCPMCRRDL